VSGLTIAPRADRETQPGSGRNIYNNGFEPLRGLPPSQRRLDKSLLKVPYIPSTAPFTLQQRAWLNGYLAGLFAHADFEEPTQGIAPAPAKTESLLVMYGSQTGSAEQLAKRLARDAGRRGFTPRIMDMNAFTAVDFTSEQRLIIVTSTWGDGDPPDNALAFWQYLNSDAAPKLRQLSFCVLALGDKNYANFCGAGKKFDERLEQLGARRFHPRADCDVDYEPTAKAWIEDLWPALERTPVLPDPSSVAAPLVLANTVPGLRRADSTAEGGRSSLVVSAGLPETVSSNEEEAGLGEPPSPAREPRALPGSRDHPFPARLITNRLLNLPGSTKDTRHFEISLEDSRITYEVGDALGVMPVNCPMLVDEILQTLNRDGEEAVKAPDASEISLRVALLRHCQITQPPAPLVQTIAERADAGELTRLLDPANRVELDRYLYGREVIDLLREFPAAQFSPAEFVECLRKLQPRLYSISSSPKAHVGEVHLTVAQVRYESHGRRRKGVCSTFLAERVDDETRVPVFVQCSHGFRLPQNGGTPIIMIGPGTGIAPFRAFLEERRAVGARGRNWLFFGDQRQACDFFYREEIEGLLADGTLTQLDTAFSRDQPQKIYVQQRMREHARQFWAWLDDGAHIYVCGDARRMAKDVDDALHEIIQIGAGKSREQAGEYVARLKMEKRYQRDVY
jgi:sulfite reductase (NADPH) flavoprotein alpha-component